jgi:hypothetical protein
MTKVKFTGEVRLSLDLERPALTLYLPSKLAAKVCSTPRGDHYKAFRVEMPLQMKLNNLLSYQGVSFDGTMARVTCTRVADLSDNLVRHRTEYNSAVYVFPSKRNGFIVDMIKLVGCC